jgi:hypothetical protein
MQTIDRTLDLKQSRFHLADKNAAPSLIVFSDHDVNMIKAAQTHMHPFKISLTAARLDCLASWLSTATSPNSF